MNVVGQANTIVFGVLDDDQGILRVPLARLLNLTSPVDVDVWEVGPISIEQARTEMSQHACIRPDGADRPARTDSSVWCRRCHLDRIRYLVEHGWQSTQLDVDPISVDVGCLGYVPTWYLTDGNHRVFAAALRDEPYVDVSIAGDWDLAIELLVGDEQELSE